MVERWARALAAGVSVGVIVQEGIWAGLGAIEPAGSLNPALLTGPAGGRLWGPLLFSWIAGGAAAGLMASLVGRHRALGHAAGALMSLAAWGLCYLAWPEAGALLVVAAAPSLGAALGTGAGARVVAAETERVLRTSVVTLRAY